MVAALEDSAPDASLTHFVQGSAKCASIYSPITPIAAMGLAGVLLSYWRKGCGQGSQQLPELPLCLLHRFQIWGGDMKLYEVQRQASWDRHRTLPQPGQEIATAGTVGTGVERDCHPLPTAVMLWKIGPLKWGLLSSRCSQSRNGGLHFLMEYFYGGISSVRGWSI